MKRKLLSVLLFAVAGCNNYDTYKDKPANKVDILINERLEANHPNLKPMYGDKIKSEEEKAIDNKYISSELREYNNDTVKAVKETAREGWYYFYKGIIDTAMFRFNQSWLINKNYPASYFGF